MVYILILILIIALPRVIIGDAMSDTVSDLCLAIITLPAIILCLLPAAVLVAKTDDDN